MVFQTPQLSKGKTFPHICTTDWMCGTQTCITLCLALHISPLLPTSTSFSLSSLLPACLKQSYIASVYDYFEKTVAQLPTQLSCLLHNGMVLIEMAEVKERKTTMVRKSYLHPGQDGSLEAHSHCNSFCVGAALTA